MFQGFSGVQEKSFLDFYLDYVGIELGKSAQVSQYVPDLSLEYWNEDVEDEDLECHEQF